MSALYLPVTLLLIGLILRGVAFDFRVKARTNQKGLWNRAFFAGSLIASLAQGYMLGMLVVGFEQSPEPLSLRWRLLPALRRAMCCLVRVGY